MLFAQDRLGVNYASHGHAFTAEDWTAMMDFADSICAENASIARSIDSRVSVNSMRPSLQRRAPHHR